MDFTRKKIRLGDVLIHNGVITEEDLKKGLAIQKKTGKKLGITLSDEGITTEEAIASALSKQLHYELVDLQSRQISDEILSLLNSSLLKKHIVFPCEYSTTNPNVLRVAMADPMDMMAIDDITIVTNLQVEPMVATQRSIMLAIDKYYGQDDVLTAIDQYSKEKEIELDQSDVTSEDVNNSPIVQLVNSLLEQAVRQLASDIHIEPLEKEIRVRYRVDGTLYEKHTYAVTLLPAIIARIKIIGGMDISEKRKPQDGRITHVVDRLEYDIRVSILPTVFGEKAVLRITSKSALTKEKGQLGFAPEELLTFDHMLSNPHGIILVTGPTGSGKSTTLYTALSELNKPGVNIITVEDPVEANIDGVNQVQVNTKADLTFATALRSILRQDPDIIMIGEVRDAETATIAVQASITGHLVVSTLHTNSAAGTITRLVDMGIVPYLLADAMVGVIAQRLIRRLCPDCKQASEATEDEKELLGIPSTQPQMLYRPCGCSKCDNIGYKGRIGVYEVMEITPALRHLISKNEDADKIKEQALKDGMSTLRMSATRYVLLGVTSIEEMKKVSFDN
ncbi:MAG: ATPase, T2SS/T4P/T4SS family [Lachnospiraceae bacterium]